MRPIILTSTGDYFDLTDPHNSEINIETIAHALSNICRFSGHCSEFYSVAQHSVLVSKMVPQEHALMGLLHDASEAFLGDVISPLKSMLPEYKTLEARVTNAIYKRFNIGPHQYPTIKKADLMALATERKYLLPATDYEWECLHGINAINVMNVPEFRCWGPTEAKDNFYSRYYNIVRSGVIQV